MSSLTDEQLEQLEDLYWLASTKWSKGKKDNDSDDSEEEDPSQETQKKKNAGKTHATLKRTRVRIQGAFFSHSRRSSDGPTISRI